MNHKILSIFTSLLMLFVGCTSRLGFKTTYIQNNGITESTQGLSADLTLDTTQ